jgi:lipopolysaccharide/colanic/teichoic acid biosynthesis glycosyltransferase
MLPQSVTRDREPNCQQTPHPEAPAAIAEGSPSSRSFSLKRGMDFALALLLLTLTAPALLVAACLVKLTSKGPVIYSQTRVGWRRRPMIIYKLRTMTHRCEEQSGPCWSLPNDSRVTRVGGFLRRSHLDELPQLWNVLRGDMSLVGPRPERPEFVWQLESILPGYRDRHLVPPGITGLAQVQLPADTDVDSVRRKLPYDLYYVRHGSLGLDLRILLATPFRLLGIPYAITAKFLRMLGTEAPEPLPDNFAEPTPVVPETSVA